MQLNKSMYCSFVGMLSVSLVFLSACGSNENIGSPQSTQGPKTQKKFSTQIELIIDRQMKKLSSIIQDPVVIQAIEESNKKHQTLKQSAILNMDRRWRESDEKSTFIQTYLTNSCAKKLIDFRSQNEGFAEIFIADLKGLNVGQTNKTSDFYQADEDWWISTYNGGKGKIHHGEIEYDESSQAEAISLYLPVRRPDKDSVIGILKAVLDIDYIKSKIM